MSQSLPPALPPDFPPSEDLLRVLLDISQNGVMLMRPVYDATGATVVDFGIDYLNPAAQQMLQLPERPAASFHTIYPTADAAGVFAFYRDAFLSGQTARRENNYQHDSLDGYFLLMARRQADVLVVTFTDTNDQPRTATEQALRISQARELEARAVAERERGQLELLFRDAPAMICVFQGPQHVFEFVNPPYQALVGPRPLVGRAIAEAMPELAGQPIFDLLDSVYRTGETYRANEMLVQLDHDNEDRRELEKRYYNFIYQARHDRQGAINGIFVFAYDVTPQVLARQQVQELNEELAAINEELRASNDEFLTTNTALTLAQEEVYLLNQDLEKRVAERTRELLQQQAMLSQILRQVPAFIATLGGPEHRYTFFNEPYQQLTGQRPRLGLPVAQALPELAAQGFVSRLNEVYTSGQPFEAKEMLVELFDPGTGQSQSSYVDFVYQPLRDDRGQTTGILVFIVDSTAKVHARRATEAAAQRLRVLTDALPVLIGYLDREQRYQFANLAYRGWFNIDPTALLGRKVRDVVGEQAYANAQGYIVRALAGERLSFESWMPYRENFVRHIRTDYIPDVKNGEVLGFYTLVTDITDQTEARERVQELNEELAAINEEMLAANDELRDTNERLSYTNVDLDTFVYTASHDLKAPIANIEGLLLALQEQLPEPVRHHPDVTHLLGLMQGSVDRFQRTLVHLTDVSKLQPAHAEPPETVDLAALIESVRLDLAPVVAAAQGQLSVDVAACPTVRFSPKNLRSIVYNLLSNAFKYHAPDRPARVRLRATCPPGQVRLEVQDNGLGLTADEQSKLFVMFRRLHTHVEGTGVGLYMVKRMVENAGGTIQVESAPGVGSTFTVQLPNRA
ncbi:PAS domain-containing protein [Hymenobacter monticola]|uniref:histidine kinase n=1 Tax=Hymenobacter monticola TaxID=1705399 RepID=A0ABY4BHJ4_9BACT|nr:PAS domain-containing protein [Hymenobacter monticola]UOE36100.1 PAS domain-containing protein [Hymenobacter monticola]